MDDTFKIKQRWLLKPITSVVVITSIAGFFFSAPQTYALGTNEDFPANLNQNYQQTIRLSDFVSKVFNFFSEQQLAQNNVSNSNTQATEQSSCEKDLSFIDIQESQYKDYIMTLYSNGIIIGSNNKFLPNNNLRFYCMIKIIVDSYRFKVGYDLKTQLGLSQKNYFTNTPVYIDKIFLKYLNTAYELGFLEGIDNYDFSSESYFQNYVGLSTIKQVFKNISKQFPLLVDSLAINPIQDGNDFMKRGEYTKYVVSFFELDPKIESSLCNNSWKDNFSDIMNHDYQEDIEILADLGIINSQVYKFYPDNYLRNYEFIIMLTKTILKKENQELEIYVLDHTAAISDLDPTEAYTKYFEYAYHNGFLDYGFDPQTGKVNVHPNKLVTIQEINNILSKLVGKEVKFKAKSSDGLITRGEFADILVDGFDLQNSNNNTNITEKSELTKSLLQQISGRLESTKLLSKL